MSIFEDLIEELKEENLLEETVISSSGNPESETEEDSDLELLENDDDSIEADQSSDEKSEEMLPNSEAEQGEEIDNSGIDNESTASTAMSGDGSGQEIEESGQDPVEDMSEEIEQVYDSKTADLFDGGQGPAARKDWDLPKAYELQELSKQQTEPEPDEADEADEILADESLAEAVNVERFETAKDDDSDFPEDSDVGIEIAGDQIDAVGIAESSDSEIPEPKSKAKKEIGIAKENEVLSEKDLYCQRLVDEVSSLQAVEHVFCGIEREQLRVSPRAFDVVPVKQALHAFIEEFKALDTVQQTEAESSLRNLNQQWHAALLERDGAISTTNLRRYCEDNNLNSKSIISLARFYRNSDFSESVRSKFDLVVTRLFSKEMRDNKRQMVFERDELIASLNELYAEWASIPVYSVDDEDSELVLAAFRFEDFITEAKKTKKFDALITSGFFKRIKAFKKKTGENFYAPLLIASAVECNVAIGNRYVDLIAKERQKADAKRLGDKYGGSHDRFVSEAASKTLRLVDLLTDKNSEDDNPNRPPNKIRNADSSKTVEAMTAISGLRAYKNIILPVVLIIGLIASGYFIYSSFYVGTRELTDGEKKVQLERSFLHEFVKTARIKDDTFLGNVTPAWDNLTDSKKEEIVGKIYSVGKVKGYNRVELKSDSGKIVAVTLGTKVEISQ